MCVRLPGTEIDKEGLVSVIINKGNKGEICGRVSRWLKQARERRKNAVLKEERWGEELWHFAAD